MISDMNYGTIVQRVRKAVPHDYARIKRMPKALQQEVMKNALAQLETFPPELQQAAKQIIDREIGRGVPYSGLGWVDTAASIATIVGTVGQIGLSVYSMQEQKKLNERADKRAQQQQDMDNLMLMEQMKTAAQNRELQKRQIEQQMAAQQAEIDMMQKMAQQPQVVPGMAPGMAPPPAQSGGMDKKTLLLAGGAAAAAVAVVALAK